MKDEAKIHPHCGHAATLTALVDALKAAFTALHEGDELHAEGCPEDDTCNCPLPSQLQQALDVAGAGR